MVVARRESQSCGPCLTSVCRGSLLKVRTGKEKVVQQELNDELPLRNERSRERDDLNRVIDA